MEFVFKTLNLMILLYSAIGEVQHVDFYNDRSKSNTVFRDSLFNISTSSLLKCIAKCNIVYECFAVSLTIDDIGCRGYTRFSGPSPYLGAKVWKKDRGCPSHFKYTLTLNLCWKWYRQIVTWKDAETLCLEEDGRLIVINSKEKRDFIRDDIRRTGDGAYYWTGGALVVDTWTWLDGTPVDMTSTFWGPGEPNGRAIAADCIGWVLHAGNHGKFDDGVCTSTNRYICEIP